MSKLFLSISDCNFVHKSNTVCRLIIVFLTVGTLFSIRTKNFKYSRLVYKKVRSVAIGVRVHLRWENPPYK